MAEQERGVKPARPEQTRGRRPVVWPTTVPAPPPPPPPPPPSEK